MVKQLKWLNAHHALNPLSLWSLVKFFGGFCWELNPRRGANSTTLLGSPSPPTKDPSVKSMGLLLGCIHGAELNLIMVWLKPWIDRESLKHWLS